MKTKVSAWCSHMNVTVFVRQVFHELEVCDGFVNMKGEYDFDIWGFEKVCVSFVKLHLDRKCYCEKGAKFVATCLQK
jgi:hypothetical protein